MILAQYLKWSLQNFLSEKSFYSLQEYFEL